MHMLRDKGMRLHAAQRACRSNMRSMQRALHAEGVQCGCACSVGLTARMQRAGAACRGVALRAAGSACCVLHACRGHVPPCSGQHLHAEGMEVTPGACRGHALHPCMQRPECACSVHAASARPLPPSLQQVPIGLYDRSVAVFGAALVIDILNSLFELRTTKLDFALLPCFIKGMATTTNMLLRTGKGVVSMGPDGRM